MKLYFSFLLFFSAKCLGQSPENINFYLNNKQISKTAKDFYNKKFKASDDERTLSIVDSLETRNNSTRPFYIFLVSKMMAHSDGALSEVLGASCKSFLELHPDNLLNFLSSQNKIVNPSFINQWAILIALEFGIECEKQEKTCIKKSLVKTSKKVSIENKQRLVEFYKKIKVNLQPD